VLLALYLDNLSDHSKIEQRKKQSFEIIEKEMSANRSILIDSLSNDSLVDFLSAVQNIDYGISNILITSIKTMNDLKRKFPSNIKISDSTLIDNDQYLYDVAFKIELNLNDLQNIAWETAKMSNITQEFNYECLQVLVDIYTTQDIYYREHQKILNHFVSADHSKLLTALLIEQQLKAQLTKALGEGLTKLEYCN
jgi:hypothetical protein